MEGLAGVKLGRYEVIKYLASGGMAQVLLARSSGIEGFERHVVIKRIHRDRALDDQSIKMFLDEARLAASLHHTNIVQVHDIGQDHGEYFFAMEYVHGEDLRHLLTERSNKREWIPLEHVVTIVSGAAAGLHHAHEQRGADRKPLEIVHRDVSPANILVGYDGTVKVADFGIAKAALRSTETQTGTLKGKISYMSPEQCMGEPVDRRSDVFALGIVLYELATVRRLFKGSSDFLTMSQIVAGNMPKPSEHRADLPPELEEIIMKALTIAPADRYQTADEMRIALDRFGKRSSTSELADYMRQVFGHRPEPWLVDDDEPEMQVDVDFDGQAAGLAATATGQRLHTPPPGSLLARARRKVALPGGFPVMPVVSPAPAPAQPAVSGETDAGWGVVKKRPISSQSLRVVAPSLAHEAPVPRRRWGFFAGVAATLAIGAVVAVTQWPREPAAPAASPAAQPEIIQPEAAAPTAAPAPEPAASPPVAPTPPVVAEPAPDKPPAAKPTRTAKKSPKKAAKKTIKKSDKKPGWDPTSLLPD